MPSHSRIRTIFYTIEVSLIIFTIHLFQSALQDPSRYATAYTFGKRFALTSLLTLTLALTPGLLQRFSLFSRRFSLLLTHRRHLGILTYLLALSHYLLIGILPSALINTTPRLVPYTAAGLFTLLTLTPLFLTSNDTSVRLLGRNWARLQKLVYLAMIFLLFHLALNNNPWSILIIVLLTIETLSYIRKHRQKNQKPKS